MTTTFSPVTLLKTMTVLGRPVLAAVAATDITAEWSWIWRPEQTGVVCDAEGGETNETVDWNLLPCRALP